MSISQFCETLLRIGHALDVRQFGVVHALFVEHFTKQTGVPVIVLNEQQHFDRLFAHSFPLRCGSRTCVSQKLLMLFTRSSNASNCTGLLR